MRAPNLSGWRGRTAGALAGALMIGLAPAALATPPTPPLFVRAIDGYADYDGQKDCYDYLQPGVAEFRTLILAAYPGTYNASDVRDCTAGVSEHKDGRAWDWGIPDGYQDDAEELLSWLLATDAYGNRYAMMRRLGLMYIIWNRQIFEAWDVGAGWQPYDGADPHTSHVHFSFAWDGALKKTSWFTGRDEGLLLNQAGYGLSWYDDTRIDAVRLGPGGDIQHSYANPDWVAWGSAGGSITSAPSGAWTSLKSYWVFGLGTDGHVNYRRYRSQHGGWQPWHEFSRVAASGVGLIASKGRLDIAVLGADGNVLYRNWVNKKKARAAAADGSAEVRAKAGWSAWEDVGGSATAAPDITRRGDKVIVVMRDGGGAIQQATRKRADTWSSWKRIGDAPTSGPAIESAGRNLAVLVRDAAGRARYGAHAGGTWTWSTIGGSLSSAPDIAANGKRRMDAAMRGPDGGLWRNIWRKGSSWAGWGADERATLPPPPAFRYPPPAVVDPDEPYEPGSEIDGAPDHPSPRVSSYLQRLICAG